MSDAGSARISWTRGAQLLAPFALLVLPAPDPLAAWFLPAWSATDHGPLEALRWPLPRALVGVGLLALAGAAWWRRRWPDEPRELASWPLLAIYLGLLLRRPRLLGALGAGALLALALVRDPRARPRRALLTAALCAAGALGLALLTGWQAERRALRVEVDVELEAVLARPLPPARVRALVGRALLHEPTLAALEAADPTRAVALLLPADAGRARWLIADLDGDVGHPLGSATADRWVLVLCAPTRWSLRPLAAVELGDAGDAGNASDAGNAGNAGDTRPRRLRGAGVPVARR